MYYLAGDPNGKLLINYRRARGAVCTAPDSLPVWPLTFVSPSADSRGAIVSCWRKYVQEVLVNRLGGLSLPRKSVVRLTDRPDMTLDVYRGHKTTAQQQLIIYRQPSYDSSKPIKAGLNTVTQ